MITSRLILLGIKHFSDKNEPVINEITLQEESITPFDFNLFPNPNDGNFTIELINADVKSYTVEIFNTSSGTLVSRTQNTANPLHINRSDLPNGTYLIRISTENNSATKRLILQK
jgi:hypothetical protein